ncbi:hypothetical protein ACFE04_009594 [Oxalis oulophora]
MEMGKLRLMFLITFAGIMCPSILANLGEFDEVWRERAEKATKATLAAYNPNPMSVTNSFNSQVNNDEEKFDSNSTRRNLRNEHMVGKCMATNPIDRCWRCRKNWARNRKRLTKCVLGFGHQTTGGRKGRYYAVTDNSDDDVLNPKPGTLRHAVIQEKPLWIIFAHDMVIRLSKELIMTSNKTIDGRGSIVHVAFGAGITIQFVENVIIHGIKIHHISVTDGGMIRDSTDHFGFRTISDGDGISVFGSTNIWLDHLSMSNCADGLIDVIQGSTAVTISNCHFTHHNDAILLGASGSFSLDTLMQVTLSFNHFGQGLIQRMPRCRLGFFHVVNNDYTHWQMYAIGGSQHPTIISQGNRFIAQESVHTKEITKREYAMEEEWKHWVWKSEGDLMMNGAYFVESGDQNMKTDSFSKLQLIKSKPGTHVTRLTRYAGALRCREDDEC